MIAAGIGCRSGCQTEDIVGAVGAALAGAGRELSHVRALCAPDFKAAEAGIREAAHRLGKPLWLYAVEVLEQHAAFTLTRSPRVLQRFGLPSIAETAALAGAAALANGAAPGSVRLLAPRRVAGGASCALASAELRHRDLLLPSSPAVV